MIEYDKFQMSLKRLEEQHANQRESDASLPELIREAIAESVIQRFETCYDCLWKVLKRYLIEELGLAEVPNSPNPIFRLASENDLFRVPLEQWMRYASATYRHLTRLRWREGESLPLTHARFHRRRYRPLPDYEWGTMGVDRAIDITAEQRKIILALLERHLPNTTAWVYGSRAKWASRPQSDLDLVVFATPEQNGRVSNLRQAFEESNLPFRVDLFVWDAVPEQFRKHIKRDHEVLVEREERDATGEWRETVYGRFSSDFVEDCLVNLCDPINGVQTGPFGSQLHKKDYVSVGTPIITVEPSGAIIVSCMKMYPACPDHDRELIIQVHPSRRRRSIQPRWIRRPPSSCEGG